MIEKTISSNVVWHQSSVHRSQRQEQNGHKSVLLWFTGLSGAGKSTLSYAVEEELHGRGFKTYVLDGDNVRHGVCGDLGFSADARKENIRRIGEMGKLFIDAGVITFSAFISPFKGDRRKVRDLLEKRDFIEIYCNASLEICEQRDVKGMYKKARKGIIKNFTGISSPYEEPESPELVVHTGELSLEKSVQVVIDYLEINGYLER